MQTKNSLLTGKIQFYVTVRCLVWDEVKESSVRNMCFLPATHKPQENISSIPKVLHLNTRWHNTVTDLEKPLLT